MIFRSRTTKAFSNVTVQNARSRSSWPCRTGRSLMRTSVRSTDCLAGRDRKRLDAHAARLEGVGPRVGAILERGEVRRARAGHREHPRKHAFPLLPHLAEARLEAFGRPLQAIEVG